MGHIQLNMGHDCTWDIHKANCSLWSLWASRTMWLWERLLATRSLKSHRDRLRGKSICSLWTASAMSMEGVFAFFLLSKTALGTAATQLAKVGLRIELSQWKCDYEHQWASCSSLRSHLSNHLALKSDSWCFQRSLVENEAFSSAEYVFAIGTQCTSQDGPNLTPGRVRVHCLAHEDRIFHFLYFFVVAALSSHVSLNIYLVIFIIFPF